MKKYAVHDYTMEQAGFGDAYTSELFDTYEEALEEIEQREYQDRIRCLCDEYYIVTVDEKEETK